MGYSKSIYIGPYLSCQSEKVVDYTTRRGCIDTSCPNYTSTPFPESKGNFCSTCGKPSGDILVPYNTSKVCSHVLSEKIKEALFSIPNDDALHHYWVPNQWRGEHRSNVFDREESLETAVSVDMIKEDQEWLQREFSEEIKQIQDAYGKDNVKISWGMLKYRM